MNMTHFKPLTVPELNTKLDELSIMFSESGFNCYCEYEDWAYMHIEAIEAVHMLSVIEC